ncbi:hypothetical protein LSH36_328g02008 [Paralvinella palmiformis]|uniref:BLOC-1-related complex subunit 6 C-terminal helix domain-containing protein n=1 Tax=Paralvinella palmiformis TaxID=53620 RepID=A0AAD9N0C5_9ANNE|nr:hypothetical protein LSH36_328g02008 [Paralvinella palmiformis]
MAEDQSQIETTEDEESGQEQNAVIDAFRYMPLDEVDDANGSVNGQRSPENGVSTMYGYNVMQTSRSSRSGYTSSGCECDSSDIEVIQESSSSIEVLDPDKIDNASYPEEKENESYNQNVERLRVDNEAIPGPAGEHEQMMASSIDMGQGDGNSQQDSLSSEAGTLRSSSSACSRPAQDELMEMPSTSQDGDDHENRLAAEARKIFAAIDALDRDCSEESNSQNSSSLDTSPFNSPSHKPLAPVEANVITLDGGLMDRPDSLSLPRPMPYYEKRRLMKKDSSASSLSEFSSRSSSMDALIEAAMSTPLQSQGMVTTEGDMVAFVASGLEHMIRMSSPMSRNTDSGNLTPRSMTSISSSASGWSTSSASGWSYSGLSRLAPQDKQQRSLSELLGSPSVLTQSPDDVPPVDPRALMDLEMHARNVANSLDNMMSTLKKNIYKMSAITCDCIGAYKEGIDNTCDAVDGSIKSMYALMAKCEELSKRMQPLYKLQKEIQEIKRLLGLFEAQMARDEKRT